MKEKLEDGEKVQLIFELENGEVGALGILDAGCAVLSLEFSGVADTVLIGADKNVGDHAGRAEDR